MTLEKEKLPLTSTPPEILESLRASRPHQIHDRAWLVMFYSVALNIVSSTSPQDELTKSKLTSNLWLAFNDVRFLLEPSMSTIQALIMMTVYAEACMTPSLSWTLVNRACTMLQTLGINDWRLDAITRKGRASLFWRLNVMDKILALILARPPTFDRDFVKAVALPALDELLPVPSACERQTSAGRGRAISMLFPAHYTAQMHLLSRVMGDIWHCLHGRDAENIPKTKDSLESWYRHATEVRALDFIHHVLR